MYWPKQGVSLRSRHLESVTKILQVPCGAWLILADSGCCAQNCNQSLL